MKLYLIKRISQVSYDEYDSAVVVAKSEEDAKLIHPWGAGTKLNNNSWDSWVSTPYKVSCTEIGEASPSLTEGEVICSSFNAG